MRVIDIMRPIGGVGIPAVAQSGKEVEFEVVVRIDQAGKD
jgi:hypothetical protein